MASDQSAKETTPEERIAAGPVSLLQTYRRYLETHPESNRYYGYERETMFDAHQVFMNEVKKVEPIDLQNSLVDLFKNVCLLVQLATETREMKENLLHINQLENESLRKVMREYEKGLENLRMMKERGKSER